MRDAGLAVQESFEKAPGAGTAGLATNLLSACSNLVEWLRDSPAWREDARLDAELSAAGGVYRNAGLTFQNLAAGNVARRTQTCKRLLAQGRDHIDQVLLLTPSSRPA